MQSNPVFISKALVLDAKHPGLNDSNYVKRRTDFYNLACEYRLKHHQAPLVEYSTDEHAIWKHIYEKLNAQHVKKACRIYLDGKEALGLYPHELPQLKHLSERLQKTHQVSLVPAEGLLPGEDFFAYLAKRVMPCTQFLRHSSDPEYTPEPDIVHDVLGHLPPLMNAEYAELMQLLGHAAKDASPERLQALGNIYWFAIEFGLIIEDDELKVFGAGLLSSYGEMEFCFSDQVEHRLFNLEEVIETSYDPTLMQKILFYIPSFEFLKKEILKVCR